MKRSLASALLAVYLSIVACIVGVPLSDSSHDALDVLATVARQNAPTKLAPPDLNINVGGSRVGRFMGDQYTWLVGVASTDAFNKADALIGGAEPKNEPMYKSHRYGKRSAGTTPWGYDIPVAEPGTYGCTVHFAETDSTAFKNGERVFDLSIQGEGPATEFKGVDVFKETKGGKFVVLTKTAPKVVVTGILKVRVAKTAASPHGAFLAGITCERTGNLPAGTKPAAPPAGAVPPPSYKAIGDVFPGGPVVRGKLLNINNGGKKVGRFAADETVYLRYGPSTVFHKIGHPIGGAEKINEPAMDTTRYGSNSNFGYQIPMASSGKWACTFHFAELVSTIKAGDRVFDIQVQDQVIENVDVMKATGGALFTTYTRTFDEVIVADSMNIQFIKKKNNPFVNAITCELGTPMTLAAAKKLLAARAVGNGVKPPVVQAPKPAVTPDAAPPTPDTPAGEETTVSSSEPVSSIPDATDTNPPSVPSVTPAVIVPSSDPVTVTITPVATPVVSAPGPTESSVAFPSSTPSPGVITPSLPGLPSDTQSGLSDIAGPSEEPGAPDAILVDITLETTPEAAAGEIQQPYDLTLTVPAGTNVDAGLGDAVKRTMSAASQVDVAKWAITTWTVSDPPIATTFALAETDTSFAVTAVAAMKNETRTATNDAVTNYLGNGQGTSELQKTHPGAEISLANPVGNALGGTSDVAKKTGNTSVIVAAVVGSALGLLLIVALIAFFVIQKHRRDENIDPTGYDAPPPLTDSDGEAPSSSAHSEDDDEESNVNNNRGHNSVDYLDDDSTFTAATSRQGDPEHNVTLDKDVWGRESS